MLKRRNAVRKLNLDVGQRPKVYTICYDFLTSCYPLPRNVASSLFDNIPRYMLSAEYFLYVDIRKPCTPSSTISTPDTSRPPSVSRPPIRPSSHTVSRSQLPPRHSPRPYPTSSVVPPASSDNPVTKRKRKPSAVLREAVSAQKKQKRRHDPETAALLANYDVPIEDHEQEPPKKAPQKAIKKLEINRSFFAALPRGVTVVRGTSVFCHC